MPKQAADKAQIKPKPRQKKTNGYRFPEKIPKGEILRDTAKREWKLGESIGKGGFGEIYSASAVGGGTSNSYVIKIEPHENGPLFVEKNFYLKLAKPEDVASWGKQKGIKNLGIPGFYGSGSHEYNKIKYRFIVIERYGRDLWSLFLNNSKKFPTSAVLKCAIQIIDVLHYIHDKGYVHGDIKGANLLLGLRKGTESNVYLVDFGLACKYNTQEFKRDPKKAHNGTIDYTSRDWHIGVPTRRGDMEILGYNLLHWLSSTLPWEKDIKNPEKVYEKKRNFMEHVKDFMKKNYPQVPTVISSYLEYIFNLEHDEAPDYRFCQELFLKELKKYPGNVNGKLDFSNKDLENKTPNDIEKVVSLTPKKRILGKRKSVSTPVAQDSTPEYDSEDSVGKTPTPRKVQKRGGKGTPVRESTLTPVKVRENTRKKENSAKKNTVKPIECESEYESEDSVGRTLTPLKVRENRKKETSVKKTTVKPAKKKSAPKPSWRDAPTAQASSVTKAGEYVRKDNRRTRSSVRN